MAKSINIKYVNWVDDEVTLTLKSLREVASFEEVMGLRDLEEDDEGQLFEQTISFFKRAFNDDIERKIFFMEPMETVLDVLEEWLFLSYKGTRTIMDYENDEEVDGLDVTFNIELLDNKEDFKTSILAIIFNIFMIAFIAFAMVFNWYWIFWGIIGFILLNTIVLFINIIKIMYKNKIK